MGIEIDTDDEILKPYYFEKFESLKLLMKEEISGDLIFDFNHETESGKIIGYIFLLKEQVSIHNQKSWPEVFQFFNENMLKMEAFFLEYKDFIEA